MFASGHEPVAWRGRSVCIRHAAATELRPVAGVVGDVAQADPCGYVGTPRACAPYGRCVAFPKTEPAVSGVRLP